MVDTKSVNVPKQPACLLVTNSITVNGSSHLYENGEDDNFNGEHTSSINGQCDKNEVGSNIGFSNKVSKPKVSFQDLQTDYNVASASGDGLRVAPLSNEDSYNSVLLDNSSTSPLQTKEPAEVHGNRKCSNDVNTVKEPLQHSRLKQVLQTDQIRELQTVIRDRETSRSDFIFYADRLIRLVIEEGLNQLPYLKCTVTTPTGLPYVGLKYRKGNCGVSIIRSGEAMEKGLRECCRSIRIGKILIRSDEYTHEARVLYAKFPADISQRKVLLMYPILGTGNTVSKAVSVLKEHGVCEENIILLNLFCSSQGVNTIRMNYPNLTILTSEVHDVVPFHFGEKYFGTGEFDY